MGFTVGLWPITTLAAGNSPFRLQHQQMQTGMWDITGRLLTVERACTEAVRLIVNTPPSPAPPSHSHSQTFSFRLQGEKEALISHRIWKISSSTYLHWSPSGRLMKLQVRSPLTSQVNDPARHSEGT